MSGVNGMESGPAGDMSCDRHNLTLPEGLQVWVWVVAVSRVMVQDDMLPYNNRLEVQPQLKDPVVGMERVG